MSTLLDLAECGQPLDNSGKTKLIKACEEKDVAMARSLLTSRASVHLSNKDGQTPLFLACKANNEDLVGLLLMARASHSRTTSAGFSPLFVAAQKGSFPCAKWDLW